MRLRLIGLVVLAASATAAEASDYFNECRTADGRYEMIDGQLALTADPGRADVPYTTVRETVLSERKGYCLAKGQRFTFEARTWVARLRVIEGGQPVEIDALCEMAGNGLPAAYACEREVVTMDRSTGPARPVATARQWTHNGSVMRLDADGAARRFVYVMPRPGMAQAGAKAGDVMFEGMRSGGSYAGTAYIFTRACGRLGYTVRGTVSADDRRVELMGEVPLLGPGCAVRGTRPDRLVFELTGP